MVTIKVAEGCRSRCYIDEPENQARGPLGAKIREGVEQRHVRPPDPGVGYFGEEGHL